MRRQLGWIPFLLTLALLAGACGGGGSDGTKVSAGRSTTTSTESTTSTTSGDDGAATPTTTSGPTTTAAGGSVTGTSTTTGLSTTAKPTTPARPATTRAPAGSTTTAPNLEGGITVFAASSLTDAFNDLGARFQAAHPGVKVSFSFAASSTLAAQVNQGAPADVLATADEDSMRTATRSGSVTAPTRFARNLLRIIVAKGNPTGLKGLNDINRVSYALCDPSVPCGKYAALAFQKNGVHASPDSYELNVKAVVARVTSGELDAGVVYRTDVFAARSKADGIDIDGSDEPDIQNVYPIALTSRSKDNATARAFAAYVTSADGRAVLASYEFLPPPG